MSGVRDLFKVALPVKLARKEIKREVRGLNLGRGRRKKEKRATRTEMIRRTHEGRILVPDRRDREARMEAARVAQAFAEKHARYFGSRQCDWQRMMENPGAVGCFSRAAAYASELTCSASDFVEAQFWYFDKYVGQVPDIKNLAAPDAVSRYSIWKESRESGEAPDATVYPAVGGRVAKLTDDEMRGYEESSLRRMVSRWGSEDKVWELFGQEDDVFSLAFRESRGSWQRMYGTGDLEKV